MKQNIVRALSRFYFDDDKHTDIGDLQKAYQRHAKDKINLDGLFSLLKQDRVSTKSYMFEVDKIVFAIDKPGSTAAAKPLKDILKQEVYDKLGHEAGGTAAAPESGPATQLKLFP